MHELSVTESILEIAIRHAQEANAAQISDINLVIGKLSSIIDDSVQFYWDFVSQGTIAEGAQLHFRRLPVVLLCRSCNIQYSPPEGDYACSNCGGMNIQVVGGDEFYVEAIDVEHKGE
jgi:hydrogenase nickel incorporation protein HypA/HybF